MVFKETVCHKGGGVVSQGEIDRATGMSNSLKELLLDITILILSYLVILSLLAWGECL